MCLLQRLTGLRRSFKNTTTGNSGSFSSKEKVHQDQMPRRSDDPDWVYFRGFGGTPYAVNHGPLLTVENCVETPKAPPRRKRPQQRLQNSQKPLRRSLSFTDAHYIAQAVYEGEFFGRKLNFVKNLSNQIFQFAGLKYAVKIFRFFSLLV